MAQAYSLTKSWNVLGIVQGVLEAKNANDHNMGWLIAFSVFFTFLIGKIIYGMRKEIWEAWKYRHNKNYFLKKQIEESKDVNELLDWKLELKDKELLKEIDRQLDGLQSNHRTGDKGD